jgi:adenylate cyclase
MLTDAIAAFARDPGDSDDVRSQKSSILLVAGACCLAGLVWSAMYLVIFGPGLTAFLPLLFAVIVGSALFASHVTRNHWIAIYAQIICIIYITTFIQWSIGGAFEAGFVMAWAFLGPLIALMYFSLRQSLVWLGLYLVNVVITAVFNDVFAAHGYAVPDATKLLFFAMNLSIASIVVFAFASYFVRTALVEKAKADRLLLNILPEKTARTLKSREGIIADEFESVSVLFADIVGYTAYSSEIRPADLVAKLNEIFHRFDELAVRHRLEKIKTIGDAYMVVGGLPEPHERPDHAIAEMGLEMLTAISGVTKEDGSAFAVRIGIHTGPVVAGVIGKSKFAYDLWGDTVNVASRLESNGIPGRIQVSDTFYRKLKDDFFFEKRGPIPVKGKGEIEAYFLVGKRTVPMTA